MDEDLFLSDESMTPKQKKIIAAAIEMFAEKGYAATSTSEIAKKAGVAEGTIFRHYKTKKELLLSIIAPMMAKTIAPFVLQDFNKVLNEEYETLEAFLRALIDNRAKFFEKNKMLFRILIQEIPFHPDLQEQFVEHIMTKIRERMKEIVEHYQAKGEIVEMPAYSVMRLASMTVFGHLVARFFIYPPELWDDEAEVERTVQFLLKGLKKS